MTEQTATVQSSTSPAEDRAYAVAVARKQAGTDSAGAEALVAALSAADLAALVAAGRGGDVAVCRILLGLS